MGAVGAHAKEADLTRLGQEAQWAARYGFDDAWPERSARRRLSRRQIWIAAAAALALPLLLLLPLDWLGLLARLLAGSVFGVCIMLRVGSAAALLTRGRTPAPAPPADDDAPVYTVLCPLYREAGEVARLVAALDRLDYPKARLDVKLLLEADDPETLAAARRHQQPWIEIVVLEPSFPRTKPKALNVGLAQAKGRFVTVYDAEDSPHPQQLRAALATFRTGGSALACVQAPLLIDNARQSWLATQFEAEYAIQFLGLNAFLARLGLPFALGGTSNHFRTEALRSAGGWDPFNVTEDAEIGYRLARDGWRLGVIAPPTWEEAPTRLRPWLLQRSRWIKGYLQSWLVLMRNPRQLLRDLGWRRFWSMQAVLGGSLISALAHGPLLAWLAGCAVFGRTLTPFDAALLCAGWTSAILAAAGACARLGSWRPALAALSMPLYWPLASIASCLALHGFLRQPHHWAKTEHGCRSVLEQPRL